MTRHISCKIGPNDAFTFTAAPPDSTLSIAIDRPGDPSLAGLKVRTTLERLALAPDPIALDLLHLAVAVYSADVCTRRVTAYDRWTRDFFLHLPVSNPQKWDSVKPLVCRMLAFLSGDRWQVEFRSLADPIVYVPRKRAVRPVTPTAVSLFSGGLDSFVGILDLLAAGQTVALVSHYSTGPTSLAQDAVYRHLGNKYSDKVPLFQFYVRPPSLNGVVPEPTTRSRSILFLSLGMLVANAFGTSPPLFVPENGLISLNVPLTPARTGTLSTRTTHPHFVGLFRNLVSQLGMASNVETPYRYMTKGEMLQKATDQATMQAGCTHTLSCSHPDVGRYRGVAPGTHCGYCVPCIIRRASMASIGADQADDYLIDVLTQPPGAGTDTGKDFRAFQMALARPQDRLRQLAEVMGSGPLPPESIGDFLGVYQRGMEEVRSFLAGSGTTS